MRRSALAALLLAGGCQFSPPTRHVSIDALPRASVRHGTFELTITELGIVRSTAARSMTAPFWGTKIARLVPEGTAVAAGEPIAWLEAQETQEEAETKEVELRAVKSELDKATEELSQERALATLSSRDARATLELEQGREEQARLEVERLRPLVADGLVSPQDMHAAEQKLDEARYRRAEAESRAGKAAAQSSGNTGQKAAEYTAVSQRHQDLERTVEELKANIEKLTVKAPVAGIVSYPEVAIRSRSEKRKVQVGDQVTPWAAFVQVADPARLEIRSQVPERRIGEVHPDTPARVTIDSVAATSIAGRVTRVESLAVTRGDAEATSFVAASDTRQEKVFEITIALPQGVAGLKPGMTATVELVVGSIPDSVFVPVGAVFDDGDAKVAYVMGGNEPERRVLELGTAGPELVVVRSGLARGEIVLLADPRGLEGA